MKRLFATLNLWGPGAMALVTLLAVVWWIIARERMMAWQQGLIEGLQQQVSSLSSADATLRMEIQTWQAYVVTLQKRMIESGIRVPDAPQPVDVQTKGERVEITTKRR